MGNFYLPNFIFGWIGLDFSKGLVAGVAIQLPTGDVPTPGNL